MHLLCALCRELDPEVRREDLLLDEVLSARAVARVTDLHGIGAGASSAMVGAVLRQPPLAA